MADTIDLIDVNPGEFVDVYTESGFAVGSALVLQPYNSQTGIDAYLQAAEPAPGAANKVHLLEGREYKVEAGENGLWVSAPSFSRLSVQLKS